MFRAAHRAAGAAAPHQRRPLRRVLATVVATALATAVLPVAVASAAPTASAALTAGQNVVPGPAEYTVNVSNNRATLGQLGGEAINYVDILLPNTIGVRTSAAAVTPPAGWTVSRTNAGGIQAYTFRGGPLAVGSSLAFTFPAEVLQPLNDRKGDLQVAVSSDNGQTTANAGGALSTTIRTLQVVANSLRATAPAGVVDGSATAGQTISYAFDVKNLARAEQTVSPVLSSNNTGDTITQGASLAVAAGTARTFTSTVKFAATGNRTAVLSASGFTGAPATPTSQALAATADYVVQAPAALALTASSFKPSNVTGLVSQTFTVEATKTNTPALLIDAGTLTLPTNVTAALNKSATTPLRIANANPVTLAFGPARPMAADGRYSVSFTFKGKDDNDFPYEQTLSLADVLNIDSVAPKIDPFTVALPLDADRRQQTAASNDGDTITVTGRLSECNATVDYVRLTTNLGQQIPVPFTRSSDGCTINGSLTTGSPSTSFNAGTLSFVAEAAARDATDNVGSTASLPFDVDLIAPQVVAAETAGNGARAERIRVTFQERNKVLGGCNRSHWRIDEELLVAEVLYGDGSPCRAGEAGPNNDRILVLTQPRDQDLQTNVRYAPGPRPVTDPAKDGAGQDAAAAVVATVVGVVPAAPVVVSATRTGADNKRETATPDGGAFYTNRPGDDLRVQFTGARPGYSVQVYDASGAPIGEPAPADEGEVLVPIGTSDGTFTRSIALINLTGKISDRTALTVILDRVAPAIGSVTKASANSVTVKFSEKLAGGSDFAENWFVYESNPQQDPADPDDDRSYYQVSGVTGSGDTRILGTNRNLMDLGALGADYIKRSPTGTRYVDRAGNALADTLVNQP